MRFGSSAGANLSFPSVCWTGVTYALVHVVSDGARGALRKETSEDILPLGG